MIESAVVRSSLVEYAVAESPMIALFLVWWMVESLMTESQAVESSAVMLSAVESQHPGICGRVVRCGMVRYNVL